MSIFLLITSVAFFLWVIRNTLFLVSLWQLKEYRVDRLFVHLRETRQGRNIFFSKMLLLKLFGILAFGMLVYDFNAYYIPYHLLVVVIFSLQGLLVMKEVLFHSLKRPVITYKALFLVFISLIFISLLYAIPLIDIYLWFLLIDRLVPFIISFFVLILSVPTELYRDYKAEKASALILQHKKLLTIGVTGSYGKSSTKEFIAQILSFKFNVLKTRGTNNTPIGVSSTILSGLRENTEIFVAEMGAYKKGEIDELCKIAHPKIGVLTAVSPQHLSLFGSLENTMSAKYELIESLPKDGLALFNGNNENAKKLYKKTKKQKVLYKVLTSGEKQEEADVYATRVSVKPQEVSFDLYIGKDKLSLTVPLLGAHTIENILPGIYLASYLGMKHDEIKRAVSLLKPLPKTMIYKKNSKGVVVIDDSFNANPDGVRAVLEYLKIYKGKKIVVLQPMIELGKKGKEEHYELAKEIGNGADFLFSTSRDYYKQIEEGIKDSKGKCVVMQASSEKIIEFLNENGKEGDVIVFEKKKKNVNLALKKALE